MGGQKHTHGLYGCYPLNDGDVPSWGPPKFVLKSKA